MSSRTIIASCWPLLVVAALAVGVHAGALNAGLVYDDVPLVRDNPLLPPAGGGGWWRLLVSDWWREPGHDLLWRPLTLLSLGLQAAQGAGTAGLHAGNLVLHAGVVVLLFLLTRALTGRGATAWIAAVLMGVHPLASEAVTLVVGRADLLVALATLAACLVAVDLRHRPARPGAAIVLIAATAAAALAKENGLVAPLLVVLVLAVPPPSTAPGRAARPWPSRRALRIGAVAAAPLPALLFVRWLVLGALMRDALPAFADNPIAHAGFIEGRLTALRLIGRSVGLFLRPWPLSIDYSWAAITVPPVSTATVWPLILGLVLLMALLTALRRRPLSLVGVAWFLGAQILTANVVVPIGTIYGERLLYLPMIGLVLVVADLLGALLARLSRGGAMRPFTPAGAALLLGIVVLVVLADRTRARERDYVDRVTIWTAARRAQPRSSKVHYNLGRSLAETGDAAGAARQYRETLRIDAQHVPALNNLGTSELRLGHPEKALAALNRAAGLAPRSAEIAFNQALALHALGRLPEARAAFSRGARLEPSAAAGLRRRGEPWATLAAQ